MKKCIIMSIFTSLLAIFGCSAQDFKSVDAEEFAREIANENVLILDVRTASEYAEGHIQGAVNIDVLASGFAERIATLDKAKTLAIYCRSGRRSKSAATQAVKQGFKVVELDGGVLSWDGKLVR